MIKKVKITFDRFKLMRRVILQAEKLTIDKKLRVQRYTEQNLKSLNDAVAELNRHEALAVADQWSTGQIRHKVETTRKKRDTRESRNRRVECKNCPYLILASAVYCPECGYDQGI